MKTKLHAELYPIYRQNVQMFYYQKVLLRFWQSAMASTSGCSALHLPSCIPVISIAAARCCCRSPSWTTRAECLPPYCLLWAESLTVMGMSRDWKYEQFTDTVPVAVPGWSRSREQPSSGAQRIKPLSASVSAAVRIQWARSLIAFPDGHSTFYSPSGENTQVKLFLVWPKVSLSQFLSLCSIILLEQLCW